MTEILPRVSFVFAVEAPICVILRRGPSTWVHVLKWNTRTDVIEPGAWHRGRIHQDCDLSPDGELFVYFGSQYKREHQEGYKDNWTAVSRAPWLSALAMWPRSDTYGSHAYFADNTTLVIDCPHWERLDFHPKHPPQGLTILPRWIGVDAPSQRLPERPSKIACHEDPEGRDIDGRAFWLREGQLTRDRDGGSPPLADFRAMSHHRTSSPPSARVW